jgi:hypothetical protein
MLQPSGAVQSSYGRYMTAGSVGTPASETGYDVDTKIFEEHASPAAGLAFGVGVRQGAADRGARLGGSGDFLGVTMANPTQNVSEFTDRYGGGDNVPVMVRGDIWVITEAAVTAGEQLYYNTSTGVLGHSGGTAVLGGRWMTSASAGQLAILRLGAPATE